MYSRFHITVNNESGHKAHYGIFCEDPVITPKPSRNINIYFIDIIHGVKTGSGIAKFSIPKERYAICGGKSSGRNSPYDPAFDSGAVDRMPVTLGHKDEQGTLVPGTTCEMVIDPGDSPSFSSESTGSAAEGSFCIENPHTFTVTQANDGSFFQGFGTEDSAGKDVAFNATIAVTPGVSHEFKPENIFYIVEKDLQQHSIVNAKIKTKACKIDFKAHGSDYVHVTHLSTGEIMIQIDN